MPRLHGADEPSRLRTLEERTIRPSRSDRTKNALRMLASGLTLIVIVAVGGALALTVIGIDLRDMFKESTCQKARAVERDSARLVGPAPQKEAYATLDAFVSSSRAWGGAARNHANAVLEYPDCFPPEAVSNARSIIQTLDNI